MDFGEVDDYIYIQCVKIQNVRICNSIYDYVKYYIMCNIILCERVMKNSY